MRQLGIEKSQWSSLLYIASISTRFHNSSSGMFFAGRDAGVLNKSGPMQDWNAKSFEKFLHKPIPKRLEPPTEEYMPRVERWLQLADQMFSTDEDDSGNCSGG